LAYPVEREGSRPDFHALIYPGSSARFAPTKDSPPVFIACGYKDRPDISRGMAEVYLKFKDAGVPAELHIYSEAATASACAKRIAALSRAGQRDSRSGWPISAFCKKRHSEGYDLCWLTQRQLAASSDGVQCPGFSGMRFD
jgi:hypothetical protein